MAPIAHVLPEHGACAVPSDIYPEVAAGLPSISLGVRHDVTLSSKAKTYAEWKREALVADKASGMSTCRKEEQTGLYDFATIRECRDQSIISRHGSTQRRLNFAINGVVSLLAQEYTGDINVLPDFGMVKPWKGTASPTEEQLEQIITAGERATWPKVEMIRNCTKIGRLLDEIVQQPEGHDFVGHQNAGVRHRRDATLLKLVEEPRL